jgi:Creatinase/Prolidase N-terminal domain
MDRRGLRAVLLLRSTNFAWYTGGADNRVDHASPFGIAAVLVTHDAEYVFTNNIEAPRMRKEQTPNFKVVEHPWYGDEVAALREVVDTIVSYVRCDFFRFFEYGTADRSVAKIYVTTTCSRCVANINSTYRIIRDFCNRTPLELR